MELTIELIDRIIEMAWEDRTPFEAIKLQFGLSESAVIQLMKKELTEKSWIRWRKRVTGRSTKLNPLTDSNTGYRFKCDRQRTISNNKISKQKAR